MLLFHRDRKSTPREFRWPIFLRHSTPPARPKKFWILENCAKRTDESEKKATSNQILPCGGLAAFFDVSVERICFDFYTVAPSTNLPCHLNIQFPFFICIVFSGTFFLQFFISFRTLESPIYITQNAKGTRHDPKILNGGKQRS